MSNKHTHTLIADLSDVIYYQFIDMLDLELLILDAVHYIKPNGMHHIEIELSGYRVAILNDLIKMMVAHPSDQVTVSFCGQQIHKN